MNKLSLVSIIASFIYSIYNLVFAIVYKSWWMLVLFAYYLVLCLARFLIITFKRLQVESKRITGAMLTFMSAPILGMVILSVIRDRGIRFHMIVMIGIATYAFTKLTLAIIGFVRRKTENGPVHNSLKSITLAEASVSIFALQRSMLVTFEGMAQGEIKIFNLMTGLASFGVVLFIGLMLLLQANFEQK